MRKHTILGTFTALALGALTTPALAAQPLWTVLQNGWEDVGPKEKNGGPGAEQATSVWTEDADGNVVITTVYMSSYDVEDYWQCRCSALRLNKDGSEPTLLADRVKLTNNGGNRPCNHPKAAVDDMGYVGWVYGTNEVNGNTRTYANVMSPTCEEMVEDVRISNDDNQNEGAPDIQFDKEMNGDRYFFASYLSTGGNDRSYARGFHVNYDNGEPTSISKDFLRNIVSPANIGRPATRTASSLNRTLFCAAKGDNRPPEDGVQCAWVESDTGDIVWKEYVAESDPGNDIYMNQPELVQVDETHYIVTITESNGAGKKAGNQKGASKLRMYYLQVSDSGMQIKAQNTDIGKYATHVGTCGAFYGQDGDDNVRHGILFEASITGNGAPSVTPVFYDSTFKEITELDSWAASPSGDGGYLQNLYGANPNTQGREFLRCVGDVPNPGYGVDGAPFADAKTLIALPHTGRLVGDEKNSMILSILPGLTDAPAEPEPPAPDPSTGSGSEPTEPDPGADPTNPPSGPVFSDADSASGCSAAPGRSGDTGSALALMLGLAMLGRRRRSSEEV